MPLKEKKSSTHKFKLFVVLNVVILFFLILAFGREYVGNMQVEWEIASLEAEQTSLENEQLDTMNLINQLSSEYYLENEARIKHGLGREGETLVLIEDLEYVDEVPAGQDDFLDTLAPGGVGNPARWFYYFFNKSTFDELKSL
ncbi:MAG: septum formation initiator family protein [Candidatus Uhrbacteria bacterium]|nr:septum formation initiator family protein [Candidatus Uhrbacteria bacterium]